jgi:hypothetical protein
MKVTPRIIALLSFYDERPEWLAACLFTAVRHLEVSHVVALDGAYSLYPGGRAWSPTEQHHAITEACNAMGVGLTLSAPANVWLGNEVEKRTALFRLGDAVSTDGVDWYLVIDADELVDECVGSLPELLAEADEDAAEVALLTREPNGEISREPLRMLFRALHGTTVQDHHWKYVAPDGRLLWGNGPHVVPALDLGDLVRVEHRHHQQRDGARDHGRRAYYQQRDLLKIELRRCDVCNEDHGTQVVPVLIGEGTAQEQAAALERGRRAGRMDQVVCCDGCAPGMIERWERDLAKLGVNAAEVQIGHAVGAAG